MRDRLLYWAELSVALSATYFLFLVHEWGVNPLPIEKVLLFRETLSSEEIWFTLGTPLSRYWNILAAPLIALLVILHDEKDDVLQTLGFTFFGLLAYGFLFFSNGELYSFYFLILVAGAIGYKVKIKDAVRITYATLALCGVYTWLFPQHSIGLFMYAAYALVFSALIATCLVTRLVFRKLHIFPPKTT